MKVLIVGGAGYVGTILRPALDAENDCCYYDRKPVPDAAERTIVADVNDEAAIQKAVAGMASVVYLAMGVRPGTECDGPTKDSGDINTAFGVNVCGLYHFLSAGLAAGVRHFIYASTLSVYRGPYAINPLSEKIPPNAWNPYGMSKRLGEQLCRAAAQERPKATILALRLISPKNEADWAGRHGWPGRRRKLAQGPNDLRRLFLAALACRRPGYHAVQTTGDLGGEWMPNTAATELLGWRPQGN